MKSKLIVSSAALGMMFMAAPAYADQDKGEHRINIGAFAKVLEHKEAKRDDHDTKATSTVAIHGTVSAVNGSVITVTGKNAAVYTIQAANAEIEDGTLASITVGDQVKVKGTVSGTMIVAAKISEHEKGSREKEHQLGNLRAGIVTAVSSNGFTIARFGTGTTTVATNASTTIWTLGEGATTSVSVGSRVIVAGATTSDSSISAKFVLVLNKGLGWMKHWLDR